MSETGARAADDATPDAPADDPVHGPASGPVAEPVAAPVEEKAAEPADGPSEEHDDGPEPSWWHRSHPTFAGLVGFFSGVAYVIAVPGAYATLLGLLVSDSTAQQLFPLVLLALVIPVAMLVPRKTRRFAMFMFLGIFSTALVIALTTALVIWVMVRIDG
jgi:hypothetical protein